MFARTPRFTLVTTLSLVSLCASTVRAAPASPADDDELSGTSDAEPSEANAAAEAAVAAFQAGRYDEAVAEFERAFELSGNPNNLFNIGRVYEEAGDLAAAVDYYTRFIAEPGVDLDDRKLALERIDVLEQILARTQGPRNAEAGTSDEPPAPAVVAPAQPAPADDSDRQRRRRSQRIAGGVVLGVGAVGLIAGGVVGGIARGTEADLAETEDPAQREDLVRRGEGQALTADVLLIAGGSLALVGLIVTLTALPKRGERRTSFAPALAPGSAGVLVRGRF